MHFRRQDGGYRGFQERLQKQLLAVGQAIDSHFLEDTTCFQVIGGRPKRLAGLSVAPKTPSSTSLQQGQSRYGLGAGFSFNCRFIKWFSNQALSGRRSRVPHPVCAGTMLVLDGLRGNNVLKKINLSWNGIADKGGLAVGEVIQGSTSLEEFDVSHNRIGQEVCNCLVWWWITRT